MYHKLPDFFYEFARSQEHVVLLETARFDRENRYSYLFHDPLDIIIIHSIKDVGVLLRQIEAATAKGFFAAGYLAYECGYFFEEFAAPQVYSDPIAWFGIYKAPLIFDHLSGTTTTPALPEHKASTEDEYAISEPQFSFSREPYLANIERIKSYIAAGDTYQINFTGEYRFQFDGSAMRFYQDLKQKQQVSYSAFLRNGEQTFLSLSPELFFRVEGRQITTRPMKGTARRGRFLSEDDEISNWLRSDEKSQAENLMIVDLLRNDVGRISEIGSVKVRDLFKVEKYASLLQMITTVEGTLLPDITWPDIFQVLFPCGSVTGAPKIRSMEIIHELEQRPRGIYTGAIGFVGPEQRAVFSVPIRTIEIKGHKARMGSGGGIVWDSVGEDEFRECELKARFLTQPFHTMQLIETILLEAGQYPLLKYHLARLTNSAEYFLIPLDVKAVEAQLLKNAFGMSQQKRYKVRLLIDRSGNAVIENQELEKEPRSVMKIAFAAERVHTSDPFLYHKTTRRDLYRAGVVEARQRGLADLLYVNESGEVTEGAISNVFIQCGGKLLTSPVQCGLLAGVYRSFLLDTGTDVEEKILYREDIESAEKIFICNAVRGLREVKLG